VLQTADLGDEIRLIPTPPAELVAFLKHSIATYRFKSLYSNVNWGSPLQIQVGAEGRGSLHLISGGELESIESRQTNCISCTNTTPPHQCEGKQGDLGDSRIRLYASRPKQGVGRVGTGSSSRCVHQFARDLVAVSSTSSVGQLELEADTVRITVRAERSNFRGAA
jgi:hypothetical protein